MKIRRIYNKPLIIKVPLDYTIALQMVSQPVNPPPRSGGSKGKDEPFQSPFGDKPFS